MGPAFHKPGRPPADRMNGPPLAGVYCSALRNMMLFLAGPPGRPCNFGGDMPGLMALPMPTLAAGRLAGGACVGPGLVRRTVVRRT